MQSVQYPGPRHKLTAQTECYSWSHAVELVLYMQGETAYVVQFTFKAIRGSGIWKDVSCCTEEQSGTE